MAPQRLADRAFIRDFALAGIDFLRTRQRKLSNAAIGHFDLRPIAYGNAVVLYVVCKRLIHTSFKKLLCGAQAPLLPFALQKWCWVNKNDPCQVADKHIDIEKQNTATMVNKSVYNDIF